MKITTLQKHLVAFTAKVGRPILGSVKTDGVTAVATDSFRLVEIRNTEKGLKEEAPLMLSGPLLKSVKMKREAEVLRHGLVKSDNGTEFLVSTKEDWNDFPNYEQLFVRGKEEKVVTVSINGRYLAEILSLLGKVDSLERVTLEIPTAPFKPILATAKGNGHEARALLMPIREN